MDRTYTYINMGGECRTHERDENYITNFSRKTWREETARKNKRRWEDNIKMDLRVIGWEGVVWIHLAQDGDQWRDLVNMVMNLRFP
jgi:hypothetical protein